ncbi:hypothetical protein [Streptomyces sp. NPDC089799]|uniref:hypothetical protein n=1 Tax=Streptomyces sp. NPDC089799 TaxID=3155066 RepID=UPI0034314C90
MLRRLVAGTAALVLVAEAAVVVLVHAVLGRTTESQSMSIAGSDPDVMSMATYALGAGMGAFLLLCAGLLGWAAVRDRPPARFARAVLFGAAVAHGLLGALAVGLLGWTAFAVLMLALCLIALTLMLQPGTPGREGRPGDGNERGNERGGKGGNEGGNGGIAGIRPTSP